MTISMSVFQQTSRPGRLLAPIANHLPILLASVYLGYVMLTLGWASSSGDHEDFAPMPVEAVVAPPRPDYGKIGDWHLFGEATAVETEQLAVAETRLQLKLQGTFVSSQSIQAAVIQADDGSRKYKIGDQVPGGAELLEIFADRVILSRNGRRESLALPKLSSVTLTSATQIAAAPQPVVGRKIPNRRTR